ncbi:hypothetical protein IW261DRAFT_1130421 [Armillaria novae-zelandiae]|uniref:Uncharacterized protein n=1 Tax=Armillaria novae-zelandiae TaxID=153914 RepID=A0AA39TCV1_9AGAR|nr:hypothetical protein IW261DRAFT_1130421 [Armillaria novae-zelandiae]
MSIPQELIDVIIDFSHEDNQTLQACALTSRAFVASSQLHLFSRIKLILSDSPTRDAMPRNLLGHTFQKFHSMISASPHLAILVTALEVYFDNTYYLREIVDTTSFVPVFKSLISLKRYVVSAGFNSIDLRFCGDEILTRAVFNEVFSAGLVELCLDGVEAIPTVDIFSTPEKWSSLRSLSILWSGFQQKDVAWDLSSLESLKVGGISSFTYLEDWVSKNKSCSELRWKYLVAVIASPDDLLVVKTALRIPARYLEEMVIDYSFPGKLFFTLRRRSDDKTSSAECTDPSFDLRRLANLRSVRLICGEFDQDVPCPLMGPSVQEITVEICPESRAVVTLFEGGKLCRIDDSIGAQSLPLLSLVTIAIHPSSTHCSAAGCDCMNPEENSSDSIELITLSRDMPLLSSKGILNIVGKSKRTIWGGILP